MACVSLYIVGSHVVDTFVALLLITTAFASNSNILVATCLYLVYSDKDRIWVRNAAGEEISTLELQPYIEMEIVNCTGTVNITVWTIQPELPIGLRFSNKTGVFSGTPDVKDFKAVFTITGSNENDTLTTTLTISTGHCEYGEYLFARTQSGYGDLILKQNDVIMYEGTVRNTGKHCNPICIPKQTYEYEFTCGDYAECTVYITDDLENYYMNHRAISKMSAVKGTMETIPSKPPTILIPEVISFALEENLDEFIRVEGVHQGITITPELPENIALFKLWTLQGKSSQTILQEFTISANNTKGITNKIVTIAIGICPQGMEMIQFDIDKPVYTMRYELFNEQQPDIPIYSAYQHASATSRGICLSEGSYIINLITMAEKPGWDSSFGIEIKNEQGIIAKFNLPKEEFEYSRHFNYHKIIQLQTQWKMTTEIQTTEEWTHLEFDDKLWKLAKEGEWGSFSKQIDTIFIRKQLEIQQNMIRNTYSHIQIQIHHSNDVEITLYLNKIPIINHLGQIHMSTTSTTPISSTSTFPISILTQNTNILAAKVKRTSTAPITALIDFDIQLVTTSSMPFLQSVDGTASEIQEHSDPDYPPMSAFSNGWSRGWKVVSFPAILRYTFAENTPSVVNRITIENVNGNRPTNLRIEGVNNDNTTEVLHVMKSNNFLFNGEETIHLENMKAFPSYQIVFLDSANHTMISVGGVRFYTGLSGQCEKRKGYPKTFPGITRYGNCPLNKVGIRQMHCVEKEFGMEWEDDHSTCLQKTPAINTTFVDWVFEITNFTQKAWNEKQISMMKLLTEHLDVKSDEIDFVFSLDTSTEERKSLHIYVRFTLEADIGDHVARHLELAKPHFNIMVKNYLYTTIFQEATILYIEVYHPLNMNSVIVSCITFVLTLLFVGCICWIRSCCKRKQSTSRQENLLGQN